MNIFNCKTRKCFHFIAIIFKNFLGIKSKKFWTLTMITHSLEKFKINRKLHLINLEV